MEQLISATVEVVRLYSKTVCRWPSQDLCKGLCDKESQLRLEIFLGGGEERGGGGVGGSKCGK